MLQEVKTELQTEPFLDGIDAGVIMAWVSGILKVLQAVHPRIIASGCPITVKSYIRMTLYCAEVSIEIEMRIGCTYTRSYLLRFIIIPLFKWSFFELECKIYILLVQ
jgi:hypothetical protein